MTLLYILVIIGMVVSIVYINNYIDTKAGMNDGEESN